MGRTFRQRFELDISGLVSVTLHTILGGSAFAFILIRLWVCLKKGAPPAPG